MSPVINKEVLSVRTRSTIDSSFGPSYRRSGAITSITRSEMDSEVPTRGIRTGTDAAAISSVIAFQLSFGW